MSRLTRQTIACLMLAFALPDFSVYAAQNYQAAPAEESGRFLLLDRPDPDGFSFTRDEEVKEPESPELEDYGEVHYSKEAWNKVREDIEAGRFNRDDIIPAQIVVIATSTPLPPQPELEFKDSGTSLSVTGRKAITLNYSSKRYIADQTSVNRPKSLSLFEITQQMQVKMQGKVGQKISVNVDYDDTKTDKQDISVVYQGDPGEVVQNVSFGDIDLSLPSTEFVSYNKQLFGIRADLKTNKLKLTFVGSRTKGQTKTKQFTGNTQFQSADILDISYLRRKYYDISFGLNGDGGKPSRLPIRSGSERIYIDQQNQAIADGVTVFNMTANDLAVQTSTYTGRFQLLNPGIDYVVDYIKGLLTFSRTLNPQDVIIIDFENAGGTMLSQNTSSGTLNTGGVNYKLLKTQNDLPIVSSQEMGWSRELKTYYPIGQTNIVHDDGRGSFSLKVKDLNRNEVLPTATNNMPQYPNSIEMDFEQGIFNLKQVFTEDGAPKDLPDPQIYSAAPVSKRIFRIEYSYRFKTFMLEPNIVTQSEVVRVDGAKLNRNEEYFIDYDSGFLTFYYPERIRQESKIEISYEVSPFGGIGNQSMVGGRVSYDFTKNFSLGSTMLYQGGIKANTVPNIGDLTNSMLVYEGDAKLNSLNIFGLRTNLGAEMAQSRLNPNLNDAALIDNMEGVKQEDAPSLDSNFWQIAANPPGSLYGPSDPNAILWNSEDVKSKAINPSATTDGTQQVLAVHYDFRISSEVSIVYPLSPTGLDFSQKTAFEIVVYGENGTSLGTEGPQFNIHLGQITEDADGSGGQNFTCEKGLSLNHAPKSEDINCDNQLAPAEDIGWLYAPFGKNQKRYGANNGRLDSQDLNKNGRLDSQDFTGGDLGYVNMSQFTDNIDTQKKNSINFSGWRTLFTPMVIASTETYRWNAIKQVRVSLKQAPGGAVSGTIKFARMAAIGNTWTVNQGTGTGSIQLQAINNIDNPNYTPIFSAGGEASQVFNKLYGSVSNLKTQNNSNNLSEQTLSLNYTAIASSTTAFVYRKFTRPVDISQHGKFNFLVNKLDASDSGASFFIQLGDVNNYFKAEVPFTTLNAPGWKLITIDQIDYNKDGIPEYWINGCNYDVIVSSKGTPSLQQIPQIIMGITSLDGTTHSGTVFVNEIYMANPLTRVGNARKVEGTFEVPGWMNFGGKHLYMDKNFQTPVTAITNQDNELETGYLNIVRIPFLPLNFTGARQIVTTPNTSATGENNLVNSLQQGKVKKLDGGATASFSAGNLPKLGFNYNRNQTEYTLMSRNDQRDAYAGTLSYSPPLNIFLIPNSIALNYALARNQVSYDATALKNTAGLYDTDEKTENYGARLAFTPWKGSTFNPGYTLQNVSEKKLALNAQGSSNSYPKSMQQTVDLNGNLRIFSWLNPGINYSVTTIENNNLAITTVTVLQSSAVFNLGEIKTVNRNSQGAINLTLNMSELTPKNRLMRSMVLSSNYQIQDGDSWQNVESSLNTKQQLWLRDSLKPKNPFAQKNSVTLRDTFSSSQRWQPFEGYSLKGSLAALNTISVTNNFSNATQKSEVTGTVSRTHNVTFPDLIFSMSQLELLTRLTKWTQNTNLNLKYSRNKNETKNVSLDIADAYGADLRFKLFNYFDSAMSYNTRLSEKKDLRLSQKVSDSVHHDATLQSTIDYRKFRFTPKIDYVSDISKGGLGIVTQNSRSIIPSLLIKTDLQIPKGLKLPFMKEALLFTNRIIWTTTISYAIKRSPVTIAENNNLLSFNSNADYEAAKNLRLTFNLGLQRLWERYLKQEEYISYQAGSTMTFQF